MNPKLLWRIALVAVALLVPLTLLWHSHPASRPTLMRPFTEAEQADEIARKIARDSIAIPTISMEASVRDLQPDTRGVMNLPEAAHEVARFEAGARLDGDVGAVLLAGRVTSANPNESTAAMAHLARLRVGSLVVTRGFDAARLWKVTKVGTYPSGVLTADVWRGSFGPRQLYLVSCAGALSRAGSCLHNVVVTAVPTTTSSE